MMRIDLVRVNDSKGGCRGRSRHHSVPTRMPMLKEAKYTQGINSGGSHNDNMASDLSSPQFPAINDVCLHYVWFAKKNYSYICSSPVKIARMVYIMYKSIVLLP